MTSEKEDEAARWQEREDDARVGVQNVMEDEPDLTYFGFSLYEDAEQHQHISREEHQRKFVAARDEMLDPTALREFAHACNYLALCKRTTYVNRNGLSSYFLKHAAEKSGAPRGYISNGMLIAAAIHLGFRYRRYGPNAVFNLSRRLPRV